MNKKKKGEFVCYFSIEEKEGYESLYKNLKEIFTKFDKSGCFIILTSYFMIEEIISNLVINIPF